MRLKRVRQVSEEVFDKPLSEEASPSFVFKPNEQHDWRQQGPYLICKSCEIEHATFIGVEKQLIGLEDDGKPILKRV